MRRVLRVAVVAACLGLTGCASLNPKNWQWPGSNAKGRAKADPERIPALDPPSAPLASRTPSAATSGVLAGQAIDAFNQRQPGTIIQVVAADAGPNETPEEVQVNEQGYFLIQGLQPGRRYKLTAKGKRGDVALAGTTYASPPNVVLLIKLSDDLTAVDPPAPKSASGDKKPGPKPSNPTPSSLNVDPPSTNPAASANVPPKYLHEPDRGPVAERLSPTPTGPIVPAGDPPTPRLGAPMPPTGPAKPPGTVPLTNIAEIPGPAPRPPVPGSSLDVPVPKPAPAPPTSTPGVPSSTVVGDRVEDFVLNDLNQQPFRFSQYRGKLTLLDFWGTWCPPCVESMPYLVELQRRYGPQGLQVIGIAYEEEAPLQELLDRVNFVRRRQGVNYKIVLGEGNRCPLLTKLGVQTFPTFILLDENGQIVWRGEGLTSQTKARLETEIRNRLAN